MTAVSLAFNGIQLNPINHNNQIWLTSSELASSLGYADEGGVRRIYNRYKDEFSASMSTILPAGQIDPLGESSGLQREIRVFSLRGCHLIAMFSRTKIAKQFRVWVLDVLDKEVSEPKPYGLKELPPTLETLHAQLQEHFELFKEMDCFLVMKYRRKFTPVQSKQVNARIDELAAQQIGTSREDLIFQVHSKIWSKMGTPDAKRGQPLTDSRYHYPGICAFLKIEPISDAATERHDFMSWLFGEHPDFAEKIIMQEPRVKVEPFSYESFCHAVDGINDNDAIPFAIVNKAKLKDMKLLVGQLF